MTYFKIQISFPLMVRRLCLTLVLGLFALLSLAKAEGIRIKGTITGYEGSDAFLSMMYGGNQYMVDTAKVVNGTFTFESIYHLESGVYLVILPPTKSFLILVDRNIPEFSFTADVNHINNTIRFDKSSDNTEYYAYYRFFGKKKMTLDKIKKDYDAQVNEPDKVALLSRMQQEKKDIIAYQSALIARIPGTLTAAMVKCELPVEVPAFNGSPEEINLQKYRFQREHYFDNVDIADERLIRAPRSVLVDRVDFYLDNLIPNQPDSIIKGVDELLARCEKTPVSYRFFLTHIFNKYREAKSIGMDAVYVHIAEEYIAKGKTPWIETQEKDEVLAAVKLISPTLIGKVAPDFTVQTQSGKDISLHSIQSPYTVLFFWAPDCTNCQQSMPVLADFYKAYKAKGVEVFGVCSKINDQEKNCWTYLANHPEYNWINGSDQTNGASGVRTQYNITTTPRIYLLDKNKTIVAKDFGVEHLGEVMNRLLPK